MTIRLSLPRLLIVFVAGLCELAPAGQQDWPMWRYDAGRSASSPNEVADRPVPLWTLKLGARRPAWDDPLNQDLMTYDRVFEPIVIDGRIFVPFNDSDRLIAYDAATGEELWTFFAEAPIRFAPAGWEGRIYVCSDDGYLYCLEASTGELQWRFRGGPNSRHVLGNRRLVSAWPARGGPVVRDGTVYFAASIWPFMGTFIYALDAKTGEVVWRNDSTGADYIKQPHSAPSFAGVGPQGALVATQNALIVPGGRSVPAVFDRQTGELSYFEINAGGKGTGGSFVAATESAWYVHTRGKGTRQFDLRTGEKTAFLPNEPVLDGEFVYAAEKHDGRPVVRCYRDSKSVVWEVEADGRGDLIRAGSRLYAGSMDRITAIRLPYEDAEPEVVSQISVEGDVQRLLAADGKLFAVTVEGDILALGPPSSRNASPKIIAPRIVPLEVSRQAEQTAQELLGLEAAEGYAFWFGADDREILKAVAATSPFEQLAIVDNDAATIGELREKLAAAGLYGKVTCHVSDPEAFAPPEHVAHRTFVSPAVVRQGLQTPAIFSEMYKVVRPYGGVMHLLCSGDQRGVAAAAVEQLQLAQAEVEVGMHGVSVRRVGQLPGSGDWTHQYGDIANSLKSDDRRVKLPLGLLWFGGSSNLDVLPRHGHGPPEQVIGGRLFIEGMNCLSARDVYTGRVLWKREFKDLGTFDVFYDSTYKDTPLDPAYNQVHIPGANARGTNFVATEDRAYILEGSVCHVMDAATGELIQDISLPRDHAGGERQWGYVGVYENVLIGGAGFAEYGNRHGLDFEEDAALAAKKAGFGSKSLDRAASVALVGFDRYSGRQLWKVEARHSFWHNGIVAGSGRIYCLDKDPQQVEDRLRRRGASLPDTYRILAIRAQDGSKLWEVNEGVFGTWLGYSEEHDLLLQAGAAASDRLYGEVGQGMTVYQAKTGAVQWSKDDLKYSGPCVLHHDLIITNANSYRESAGAFSLIDGSQKIVSNPFTGEPQPWTFTRAYGCNNVIASEYLLTFRSGAAGFYDLLNDGGTGNLGGFKSGCTSNLVVAGGVLNAPDYTRTCSCAYQNQTSLALVHMPEFELWTVHPAARLNAEGGRILRLGINFGAPGDRRDDNGLVWLEYPSAAGDTLPLDLQIEGEARWFRRHSSTMGGTSYPWVLASGVEGVSSLQLRLAIDKAATPDRAAENTPDDNADKKPAIRVSEVDGDSEDARASASATRAGELPYRLRLFFAAPADADPAKRVFDVVINGAPVLTDVELSPASPSEQPVVCEVPRIMLNEQLRIDFNARAGRPVLCGLAVEQLAD